MAYDNNPTKNRVKLAAGERVGATIACWVSWVARRPIVVLLVLLLALGGTLHYTVNHLKVNTDTSNLLSSELPFRQAYLQYEAVFPQHINTFLIVIDGETPLQARAAARLLAQHLKTDKAIIEDVYTPQLGAFFDRSALLYLDTPELYKLSDRLATLQPFLAKLASEQSLRGLLDMLGSAFQAAQDGKMVDLQPILTELNTAFLAPLKQQIYQLSWQQMMQGETADLNQKRQFIVVKPHLDFSQIQPAEVSIMQVRHLIQELGLTTDNGIKARLTGLLALEYEELQSVKQGGVLAAVLSLGMAVIALWFAFRSLRMVLATFITLLAGLLFTAGFAALAIGQLNMITVVFGVLYIGLGVDFAIHLGLRYRELCDSLQSGAAALHGAALDIGPSLLLCALTTAVGFYSFIPTDYVGVSELGIISGTGMFISFLVTLTLLPALLSLWPFRVNTKAHRPLPKGAPAILTYLPRRHAVAVRLGAMLMAFAALFCLPWVHFDYDPLSLRDTESESVQTFIDLLNNSTTPPRSITVLEDDAAQLKKLLNELKLLATVDKVLSIDSFVPADQDQKLSEIEDLQLMLGEALEIIKQQQSLSETEQALAISDFAANLKVVVNSEQQFSWHEQAAALDSSLQLWRHYFAELPATEKRQVLDNMQQGLLGTFADSMQVLKTALTAVAVARKDLPEMLRERWISDAGIYRIEVFPQEDISQGNALQRFVEQVRGVAVDATGPPVVALESGKAVVGAFQEAFIGAWLVISLLLLALLRKFSDATYVIIPLLWAGLITGAATVLLDIPFNFANIIALPLLLGIGVDNGIHVVHRMRGNRQSYEQLLKSSTARGIYYSGLTTIVSFLSLSFSAHPGTASMGIILTLGVLMALLGTLLVLPAILAPKAEKSAAIADADKLNIAGKSVKFFN